MTVDIAVQRLSAAAPQIFCRAEKCVLFCILACGIFLKKRFAAEDIKIPKESVRHRTLSAV